MSLATIAFLVPGEPVPKARPRVIQRVAVNGFAGTTTGLETMTRAYTPKRTVAYEQSIGWHAKEANPGLEPDAEHEWAIWLTFYCRRHPDLDNLVKSALDGLTGVIWMDDRQVTFLQATRRPAGDASRPSRPAPGVAIEAWSLAALSPPTLVRR